MEAQRGIIHRSYNTSLSLSNTQIFPVISLLLISHISKIISTGVSPFVTIIIDVYPDIEPLICQPSYLTTGNYLRVSVNNIHTLFNKVNGGTFFFGKEAT